MRIRIRVQGMRKVRLRLIRSFTLIELMVVVAIIGLLAGILLAAAGGVRNQAARSQAKAEIAALEAALVRYQSDFGIFPHSTNANPTQSNQNPSTTYLAGSRILFTNLMGRATFSAAPDPGLKAYLEPKVSMVITNGSPNYFIDPWGYAYGYNWDTNSGSSLFGKSSPDVWSTGRQSGSGNQTNRSKWISSWIN